MTKTRPPSGSIQIKKGMYSMVIYMEREGKMTSIWRSTGLHATEANRSRAEDMLEETRMRIAYDPAFREDFVARKRAKNIPQPEGGKAPKASKSPPPVGSYERILVADYIQQWYRSAKRNLAKATQTNYEQMLNCRIYDHFRSLGITMAELRPIHIQQLIDRVYADGCSGTTAQQYYALVKRIFSVAFKQDILPNNPADKVDRPRKNQYRAEIYTAEEVKRLLEASASDEIYLPVVLSAFYGLRRSEVLGLRWSSIDFTSKQIEVNHKLVTYKENGKSRTIGEDTLKTKSSHRTLPLIPAVEEILLAAKERQEIYRKKFKRSYNKDWDGYLCVLPNGDIIEPNFLTAHFRLLLKQNGLKKIRFHDLRHTCASLLVQSGVGMKQVQLWMGHSDFGTTANIYSHLTSGALVQSANVMGGLLGEGESAES